MCKAFRALVCVSLGLLHMFSVFSRVSRRCLTFLCVVAVLNVSSCFFCNGGKVVASFSPRSLGSAPAGWGDAGRAPLAPAARGIGSTQTRNTGDPKKHWRHGAPGTRYWNEVSESWGTGDPGTLGALGHLGHVGHSGTGHQAHRERARGTQFTQEISFEGREALSTRSIGDTRHLGHWWHQAHRAASGIGHARSCRVRQRNMWRWLWRPPRNLFVAKTFWELQLRGSALSATVASLVFFFFHHELCCPEHFSFMDA